MVTMTYPNDDAKKLVEEVCGDVTSFLLRAVGESERAAVILGAARLDLALKNSLCSLMHHNPSGKGDDLFDPDRPLGTFSSKINLAHRLGLFSDTIAQALHTIRKIRNECAHSLEDSLLVTRGNRQRLRNAVRAFGNSPMWGELQTATLAFAAPEPYKDFLMLLVVLIVTFEASTPFLRTNRNNRRGCYRRCSTVKLANRRRSDLATKATHTRGGD